VLFSELLVWGWIRRQYLDHKIGTALRSLAELHPDDSARRTQLLTEIAAAVEAKDPFLYGHSRRVARYVMRVARRMHLDRSDVGRVRTAALLHDVGKLHTPPEVLLQPRRLDAEETAVTVTLPTSSVIITSDLTARGIPPGWKVMQSRWDRESSRCRIRSMQSPRRGHIGRVCRTTTR